MRKLPYKLGTYEYTRLETILLAFTLLTLFGLSGLVLYVIFDFAWCSRYQKAVAEQRDTKTLDVVFWVVLILYILIYLAAAVIAALL